MGPPGPNAAFKMVSNDGLVFTPNPLTNLLRLDFQAPANGFVYASATGYCNTVTGTGNMQWGYIIGTSAAEGWGVPLPLVYFPNGSNVTQFPIVVTRVLPVTQGAHSLFLNVQKLNGNPVSSCAGTLTAFFTATQLQ